MNKVIYSVNDIRISMIKRNPPILQVIAHGMAPDTDWTNALLIPQFGPGRMPADGNYRFEFRATPPLRRSLPVLTPVTASFVFFPIPADLRHITVVATSNEMTESFAGVSAAMATLEIDYSDVKVYTGLSANGSFDEALDDALSKIERPLDLMTKVEVISMEATVGGIIGPKMLYVTIQTQ